MERRQSRKIGELHDLLQSARRQIGLLREVDCATDNRPSDLIKAPLGKLESLLQAIEEFHESSPIWQEKSPQPQDPAPAVRVGAEQILALIPAPCLVTDLQHRVRYANQAASVLLGIPEGHSAGKPLISLLTKKSELELSRKVNALPNG